MPPTPDPAAPPDAVRPHWSSRHPVAALSVPVLGFWLPFLGFFASLALALSLVPLAGARLWRPARFPRQGVALLGFAAMWLPAFLAFFGVSYALWGEDGAGRVGSTVWLLIPLCAPEQPFVSTLIASAVYVAGAALSGVVRRPWPWVVGALLSALAYDLVLFVLSVDFLC